MSDAHIHKRREDNGYEEREHIRREDASFFARLSRFIIRYQAFFWGILFLASALGFGIRTPIQTAETEVERLDKRIDSVSVVIAVLVNNITEIKTSLTGAQTITRLVAIEKCLNESVEFLANIGLDCTKFIPGTSGGVRNQLERKARQQ